jgi:hypothetical protein
MEAGLEAGMEAGMETGMETGRRSDEYVARCEELTARVMDMARRDASSLGAVGSRPAPSSSELTECRSTGEGDVSRDAGRHLACAASPRRPPCA